MKGAWPQQHVFWTVLPLLVLRCEVKCCLSSLSQLKHSECLTGLTLLHVHKEISINIEKVASYLLWKTFTVWNCSAFFVTDLYVIITFLGLSVHVTIKINLSWRKWQNKCDYTWGSGDMPPPPPPLENFFENGGISPDPQVPFFTSDLLSLVK